MRLAMLEQIERRYDPEHDIAPGPAVTWTDMQLVEAVYFLAGRVAELERIVAEQRMDKRIYQPEEVQA